MSDIKTASKERLEASKDTAEIWLQTSKDEVVKWEARLNEIVEALKSYGSEAVETVQETTETVVETVKEEVKKVAPKRTTKKAAVKAEEKVEEAEKSDK